MAGKALRLVNRSILGVVRKASEHLLHYSWGTLLGIILETVCAFARYQDGLLDLKRPLIYPYKDINKEF